MKLSTAQESVLANLQTKAPAVHTQASQLKAEFLPGFLNGANSLLQAGDGDKAVREQLHSLLMNHLRRQSDEDGALDTDDSLRLARPGAIRNFH